MNKTKLKPKHIHKSFGSQEEFEEWLSKTTYKSIILEDKGQDLTEIFVDKRGEILHSNFHARIYNGLFVNIAKLKKHCPIEIFENGQWTRKNALIVKEIRNYNTYAKNK